MATDDSTTPAAAAAFPEHLDVLNALQDIQGAITLSRQAAANDLSGSEAVTAIEGTLTLVDAAINRLYVILDSNVLRDAWPTNAEVAP